MRFTSESHMHIATCMKSKLISQICNLFNYMKNYELTYKLCLPSFVASTFTDTDVNCITTFHNC